MSSYLYLLFLMVSFIASVAGSVCGIGGGVIIKPVLDAFGVLSVSSISFLSGCTVLAMSFYSILKKHLAGELLVDMVIGTPLAVGAAAGGILGKMLFQYVLNIFTDKDMIGAVQAFCLFLMTAGTLLYTLKKENIKTYKVNHGAACAAIGVFLGVLSSFLGIGGGPINLVVLFYFFSMDTKTAAQNSLYIILFSQITSLCSIWLTKTVPDFSYILLVLMVLGGISGGAVGRIVNKNISEKAVDQLFIILMIVIIGFNIYNVYQFIL